MTLCCGNGKKAPGFWYFLIALALYSVLLEKREILMIDTRFALFVHELGEGAWSAFPSLYGQLYPDYTSLPTTLSLWSARLFGAVDQFTLTFPSAAAAALIAALTFRLGRKIRSEFFGHAAVLLLFASFEYLNICRISSIDLYVALAGVLVFAIFLVDAETPSHWSLPLALPLLAAGFLARGPIGLVIPTAIGVAVLAVGRKWKKMIVFGLLAVVLLAGLLALWLWAALHYGGRAFYERCLVMQITSRMEKGKPVWYYFTNAAGSFALTYPLALVVLVLALKRFRRGLFARSVPGSFLFSFQALAAAMLIVILGMSVPGTKHLRYVTPAMPFAALLSASLFTTDFGRTGRVLRETLLSVAKWLPLPALAGFCITKCVLQTEAVIRLLGTRIELPWYPAAVLVVIVLLDLALSRKLRRRKAGTLLRLAVLAGVVTTFKIGLAEEIDQATLCSADFVGRCEAVRNDSEVLTFFGLGPDGDENKYMIHVRRERIFVPRYLRNKPEQFQKIKPGDLVIVRLDRWRKLPADRQAEYRLLLEGRLGRRECALVRKL